MNAIDLLKQDHDKVKDLFEKFEDATEYQQADEARGFAEKALRELTIHAQVEEEVFYPAVRAKIDDEALMDEAAEEHHVAKLLIAELLEGGRGSGRWDAKFIVLAESVKHHIKEEEGEMFPRVKRLELDLEDLGTRMQERKEELQRAPSRKASRPRRARVSRRAGRARRVHARR